MPLRNATLIVAALLATALTPQIAAAKARTAPPAPPPAPAGFAASLRSMYANMYATATTLDAKTERRAATQLPSTSEFAADVRSMTRAQLAAYYAGARPIANWSQLGRNTRQLLQDARLRPTLKRAASPALRRTPHRAKARKP